MAIKKETRRALRRPFETAGFRLMQLTVPLLPRHAVVGIARLAGLLAHWVPMRETRMGMKNIEAVFGDTKTTKEKRAILGASFSTFCLTMLDIFWFSRHQETRIPKYVAFSPELDVFFEPHAKICITAHFGNWEVMGQAICQRGIDMATIAATIKNPHVDALLRKLRESTGQSIIPQKGAMRTLIARLRKKGKVGFVLDQNTKARDGGIQVDFMGLPMSVSSAPAALAYRTGTQIIFGFSMPQPGGRYLICSPGVLQPPPFDKTADSEQVAHELTQQIQDIVSAHIRQHPEHWLWSYKHWRRVPGESYPDHYPNY